MEDALSDAKQTLLRALESIEEVEQEMEAEVRYVAVVYSVFHREEDGKIHEQGGWNHSDAPAWLIAAMLRHGADEISQAPRLVDDEE